MTPILLTCLVSSCVQFVAIFFIFFLMPHELLFLFWFFIYCCGWLVNMIVAENIFHWDQKKRWVTTVLLLIVSSFPPLLLSYYIFSKRVAKDSKTGKVKNKKLVIASGVSLFFGVILTVVMELFFPLDSFRDHMNESEEITLSNENEAILGLEKFFKAQQDYFTQTHHYALFPIHLWQDVDEQGGVIPRELIDKKLAFAMGPSLAVKGYYFMSLFYLEKQEYEDAKQLRLFDYGKEWAILALPQVPKKSGRYFFLIRQDGIIWQKNAVWGEPKQLAWDLIADGWNEKRAIKREEQTKR